MSKRFGVMAALCIGLALLSIGCERVPLPDMSNLPQPLSALAATQTPAPTATPAPSTAPESSRKSGKPGREEAALFQILTRLGWSAGVVAKTSGDEIALRTVKGSPEKIEIGSNTIILVPDRSNPTVSDIHVGDRVAANVPRGDATAALVLDVPTTYTRDNLLLGMVQSNSGGTISLRTKGGSESLMTNSTTQVVQVTQNQVTSGTLGDLQSGNMVLVIGQENGDEFNAQVIFVLPKGVKDLGKGLGKDRKNLTPPATPTPGS